MISVLIASYNRAHFLDECIKSVRNSTYKDLEIVLVDDGSIDGTEVFASSVDVFKRIEHQGISAARNEAMRLAHGDRFFILDSDDYIDKKCIEKEDALMDEENADLVFCTLTIVNELGHRQHDIPWKIQTFEQCLRGKSIPHGSSLFKKAALDGIWYDETLPSAVDYDFLLKFLKKNPKLAYLEESLYNYRVHGSQQWGTKQQLDTDRRIKEMHST